MAGSLNVRFMRGLVVSEHDRQAGHAFASNEADFDLGLLRLNRDHGREAGIREVYIIDSLVRPFENLPKVKAHGLKVRQQQP
jgi:hypothetical protein